MPLCELDLLLQDARYDDGSAMTDDEIVGNLIALMMAGQHTSNITSSWLMLNLLSRPDVLKRVMEEQVEIVGDDEHLTFEKVKDMQLLEHCVKGAYSTIFLPFSLSIT